jgi:LCP family protein required for cell wall assembly
VEEDNGRTHGKLNQAYFYGTEGMGYYSGSDFGAGLLKATFQYNWNFNIDRYVVINLRTFRDVIDAVGGIEIYNPSPLYSFHQSDKPVLRAGSYFFTGSDALNYARYRDPKNVYDRVDRQAIVLNALYEAVFSLSTIPKIPKLVGLYKGNVLTDLHLAEVSQFLCLAAIINPEEVRFSRIPKEALYFPDWEGFVWLEKKPGTIEAILNQFQEGAYPE